MAVTRQKKEEALRELIDRFTRSKTVVFADYRGLDVKSISGLRKQLREKESELKVGKKTLMRLAAKEIGVDEIGSEEMEGSVAAIFSYEDELSGLRILFKFSKENEKRKLLGGIIDGKVVDPNVVQQYAKLPSREELLAKFLGSLNAPLTGFVGVLSNVIGGFVRVVNAYKESFPSAPVAAPVVETLAEPVVEVAPAVESAETTIEEPVAEVTPVVEESAEEVSN